jgi:hypothetical protein
MANEKRVLIVNGSEYELPVLWTGTDVDGLMKSFEDASNAYVSVTLDDGVVHVLVNSATQVSISLRTPAPSKFEATA